MGDNTAAPVIAGLAVGIVFVIALTLVVSSLPPRISISTVADDDVTFYSSPTNMTINEVDDIDGCCGEMAIVALVTIPEGASNPESGKRFEPQTITVVIGVNNTVRWINQDTTMHFIEADNDRYDPVFYQLTDMSLHSDNRDNVLMPNDYFEYAFTKPGEYSYHSKPWMRGTVIVLEAK